MKEINNPFQRVVYIIQGYYSWSKKGLPCLTWVKVYKSLFMGYKLHSLSVTGPNGRVVKRLVWPFVTDQ